VLSAHDGLLKLRTGLPRPAFGHESLAAEAIRRVFLPTTRVSWERGEGGGQLSERSRLYAACAALLNEQARAAASAPQNRRPPVASAFVTTFDVELEMALLSAEASPFLVAVPYHVLVGSLADRAQARSHPVWIAYVVRPGLDGLDGLLAPTEWIVLHNDIFGGVSSIAEQRGGSPAVLAHDATHLRLRNLPVVVRLSGSPLVKPPPLYDPATNTWTELVHELASVPGTTFEPAVEPTGDARDPGMVLEHAVVIDEYAAMQQTAAELFAPGTGRIGLPTALAGGSSTGDRARFWVLLGVQVGDPGVRHRVAFEMSAPALTDMPRVNAPDRPGVVVNRRLSSEDQELLHWFGFDVVHGRCQDFIDDLERIAAHHAEGWWHPSDAPCSLEVDGR
jgi:hypothetical protein